MATMTLSEAARQARTSKRVILRAIRSGRVAAVRTAGGGWAIDADALVEPATARSAARPTETGPARAFAETGSTPAAQEPAPQLDSEIAALAVFLDLEARRAERRRERETEAAPAELRAGRAWWRRLAG